MENIFKRVHWDDGVKRRSIKEIDKEINRINGIINKHQNNLEKARERLDKTKELRARSSYQEELSKDGIEVNILEVKPTLGGWTCLTNEELRFISIKKPQESKITIARSLYDYIKENPNG